MSDPAEAFERHHLAVYRFLLRMSGDRAAAEELTQDTFLRAVRMAAGPDGWQAESERSWLFRVARNLLLNRRRDDERRPKCSPLENAEALGIGTGAQEDRAALREALEALAFADREVVLLRELGGLTYDEIAGVTGTTQDAVRSRLHRARLELRDALRSREQKESTP